MAQLTCTILPAKALKSGKNKVRIAVAHNSQTRYILTDVTIDSEKEFKNGQVIKRPDAAYLNTKLRKKLNDLQRSIDALPYIEGLSCAELISAIAHRHVKQTHTLESAFNELMDISTSKESTKKIYRLRFKSITRHIPANTLVKDITPLMVKKYIKKRSDLKPGSLKQHVGTISMIVNHCQRNGYTDFRSSPTSKVLDPVVSIRHNWLSPDQVRSIRDVDNERWRHYSDMFMLSYYLGGINLIDLLKIDFNKNKEHIKYIRTKTERNAKVNPFVEFGIPKEAKLIIERNRGRNGRVFGGDYEALRGAVCRDSRRVSKAMGIPELTYYSARKSFAQHAFNLGISESIIDYILGHSLGASTKSMLYSYIKVTPEMATGAVRKVCDFIASTENF